MERYRNLRTAGVAALAAAAAGALIAGCSSAGTTASGGGGGKSSQPSAGKTLRLAYLSFAVANSYDAPMLAAAQKAAAAGNAKLTVFDAKNSPQTQFSQLQNVISSGQYDGVIVQPILGTGLTSLVAQAVAKGIKVVNIDQILGPDYTTDQPQVQGLAANVTFIPSKIGTQLGQLAVQACQSKNLNPCNVGYLYDIKASTLDVAIHKAFVEATSGTPAIKLVAEAEDFFTPAGGLKATQNMLQAHADLGLIVGSDQGLEGATQALSSAGKTGKVLLVGFGASAAGIGYVKSGAVFGDVAQAPASEGRLGVEALVKALRSGTVTGGVDPVAQLPNGGIVTKGNVEQFSAEWPG